MEHIAVIATTITIIGETIPAATAASPSTSAPKIERDVPLVVGVRASASYNNSNVNINKNASINPFPLGCILIIIYQLHLICSF